MRMVRVATALMFAGMMAGGLMAQSPAPAEQGAGQAVDPGLNIRTVELWPNGAPGAQGTTPKDVPALSIFAPHKGRSNGGAVIIAPGGAYLGLAADLEGREVADWYAVRGFTAFVLRYRLGAKYLYPIPLQDAQRAVRFVRANAQTYQIDPNRIGFMGFSAGGHLAAMEATTSDAGAANASDAIDRVSDRPDFLVLGYPWLNAMEPNAEGKITYCSVLPSIPPDACKGFETRYSPVEHVTSNTPPTFLYITSDDKTVDVGASVAFYQALRAVHVPVEFHSFAHGSHGSGLGSGDPALDLWPTLLDAWLRGQGFFATPHR